MTTIDEQFNNDERFRNWELSQRRGRVCAGIFLLIAAGLFFAREAGYPIPHWLLSWPMLLVAIGLVSGIKHRFRKSFWLVLVVIGGIFLAGDIIASFSFYKFRVPLILLFIGLILIFRPKHRHRHFAKYQRKNYGGWNACSDNTVSSSDDFVTINNVFGATKRNIISKDFKGGDIRNTFGGCELNLMQADINGEAILTVNQHFGGTKLIVPANWIVKSDIETIMGGVEDERQIPNATDTSVSKTLTLKGHVLMGGLEIVSY